MDKGRPYEAGTILLSGGYKEHLEMAKEYILKNEFTPDDVKMASNEDGDLLVIAKRDVCLKC